MEKLLNTFRSRMLKLKSSSLHGNISADDCARELFKPSKGSVSLHVCNEEKHFWGFQSFLCYIISGVVLGRFDPFHLALGPNR